MTDPGPIGNPAARRTRPVGLIQTSLAGMKESLLDKTKAAVDARLAALDCAAADELRCAHSEAEVAKYDPCQIGSRLGFPVSQLTPESLAGVDGLHQLAEGELALTHDHGVVEARRELELGTHRREPAADEHRQLRVARLDLLGAQPTIGDHVAEDPRRAVEQRPLTGLEDPPLCLLRGVEAAIDDDDLVPIEYRVGGDGQELKRQQIPRGRQPEALIHLLGLVEDDLLLLLDHARILCAGGSGCCQGSLSWTPPRSHWILPANQESGVGTEPNLAPNRPSSGRESSLRGPWTDSRPSPETPPWALEPLAVLLQSLSNLLSTRNVQTKGTRFASKEHLLMDLLSQSEPRPPLEN